MCPFKEPQNEHLIFGKISPNQAVSLSWEVNNVITHHPCSRVTDASSFQPAFHLHNHIELFSPGVSLRNGRSRLKPFLHIQIFLVLEVRVKDRTLFPEFWSFCIYKLLTSVTCYRWILKATNPRTQHCSKTKAEQHFYPVHIYQLLQPNKLLKTHFREVFYISFCSKAYMWLNLLSKEVFKAKQIYIKLGLL